MKTGQMPGLRARSRLLVLFVPIACLLASAAASASDIVSDKWAGSLRNAQGRILMDRGGREIFGRTGMRLFKKDVIHTGDDASTAVVFRDETNVRVGPNSDVSIDDFAYDPQTRSYGLQTGITRGVAVFATGALAKVAPESVAVTTPKGTIGIRGTRFTVKVEE
jgi:hypothetical protein